MKTNQSQKLQESTLVVILPLRTVSIVNQREHWSKRASRAAEQRGITSSYLRQLPMPDFPLFVQLTRLAPRELDDDNLRSALKSIRDGVADWLGINDRDKRVEWHYAQLKQLGKPPSMTIRIIQPKSEELLKSRTK